MSRSRRIFARARTDIDRIFEWLSRRSSQGAANWYDALFEAVRRILESPDTYPAAPEALPRWGRTIQHALFKTKRGRRYRILFELMGTEVRILRIRGPGQPPLRRRDLPSNA